ncbi:MAG: YdcF family protein [Lachnospiraceae bacterium]|nr:YdcF family protein [Lachnospiraceae bacterium]
MKRSVRFFLTILFIIIVVIGNILIMRTSHRWFFKSGTYEKNGIDISMDKEGIIEVEEISFDEKHERICLTLKGIQKGSTKITVSSNENGNIKELSSQQFNVGLFDIITCEGKPGLLDVHVLKLELILLYVYMVFRLWLAIKKEAQKSMYSYTLVTYIGSIFLLSANILGWTLDLIEDGVHNIYLYCVLYDTIDIFMRFSMILSPLVFMLALFLILDNAVLIKKEGKSLNNILGVLLGLFLAGMTVFGAHIYNIFGPLMSNDHRVWLYLSTFVESVIYTLLAYFECMMLGNVFCTLHAQKHVPSFDKDFVIILGCSIRKDGTLTPLLKGRADKALWFAKKQHSETGKELCFVASGGQGSDEVISEAEAIGSYLTQQGIPGERIIIENRSTSTSENMRFSNELIKERMDDARIAFSTTGYHVFRSGNIAHNLGINASGMGSRTKWYFYINAMIREFMANMNIERKKHITSVLIIVTILAIIIQTGYVFDII